MFDFLNDLNLLRPYVARRDKWKFVILLCLMLAVAGLEAIGLGTIPIFLNLLIEPSKLMYLPMIGGWFKEMPAQASLEMIIWGALGLLFVFILKNSFSLAVYYYQNTVVEDQRVKLSLKVFSAYQNAPYEWHLQRNSAEFIRNVSQDTRVIIDEILMSFIAVIMSSIITLTVIAVLVMATPSGALLAVGAVTVGMVTVIMSFKSILRHLGEVTMRESKLSLQAIMQGIGAILDARIFGSEKYLNNIFRSSIERMAHAQKLSKTVHASSPYIIEIISILGLLLLMISLAMQSGNLQSQIPVLSLFAFAIIRLKQSMGVIAGSINVINSARASIPHIIEDLSAIDNLMSQKQTLIREGAIGEFQQLSLKGVTYHYPDCDTAAVKSIDLELKCGESIAFVGTTGCGKSTLINIILGFLKPQQGDVEVNGAPITHDIQGWHRNIGYIPQTIFLIDDTIRANVAFGLERKNIRDEQVWEVLRTAYLDDYVKSLPGGLDTVVGERGVRLSGGQRQRLGIARALYRNPQVIVMDEATSALDNNTEASVMDAITASRKDRTFIMIAHRLSTVEMCDRQYKMENGKILS